MSLYLFNAEFGSLLRVDQIANSWVSKTLKIRNIVSKFMVVEVAKNPKLGLTLNNAWNQSNSPVRNLLLHPAKGMWQGSPFELGRSHIIEADSLREPRRTIREGALDVSALDE